MISLAKLSTKRPKTMLAVQVAIASDGETLIRGPHVFKGYYNDPAATDEALTADGWPRSGDLGAIDARGFVKIRDRKKDLIITSSGKNITPVNIESLLRAERCITKAVVFGDDRPYLVALLALDRDESFELAGRLGLDTDPARIARNPRVHEVYERYADLFAGLYEQGTGS